MTIEQYFFNYRQMILVNLHGYKGNFKRSKTAKLNERLNHKQSHKIIDILKHKNNKKRRSSLWQKITWAPK